MSNPFYKYLISLDVLFGSTSIFCLTAISLERMFAVKYPATHHNLSDWPFRITICVTWVYSIFITALKLILGTEKEKEFTMIVLILAFLLPLAVITCCYAVIFNTARNMFEATNQKDNLCRDIQVAKTISVIIGLFVLCWLPFFLVNVLYFYGTAEIISFLETYSTNFIISVTKGLHYSNSMMNFFVYAVRSPDFHAAFKSVLCSRFNKKVIRERLRTMTNNNSAVSKFFKDVNKSHGSNTSSSLSSNKTILSDYSLNTTLLATGSTTLLNEPLIEQKIEEDNVFL